MPIKTLSLLSIACFFQIFVYGQTSTIFGTVSEQGSRIPIANITVELSNSDFKTMTDMNGSFQIGNVPYGDYELRLSSEDFETYTQSITVSQAQTIVTGLSIMQREGIQSVAVEDIIPTVTLTESDLGNDGSPNVSGLLTASRDPFITSAAFTFGPYRYRIRGYDSENAEVYINNIPVNELENGRVYWSNWGGLNDVFRNRSANLGLSNNSFSYGGIGGATNMDTRASKQWKQLRLTYSLSNRSYENRLMGTYSTGVTEKGWAVSLSASRRWAHEGYVPGTFYDAWAYFAAVEKKFGNTHSIALTTFGAPIRRGRSSSSFQEMYDIAGTNYYNPNWGYQDGEKRNARVGTTHQPHIILNHEWNLNHKGSLLTSAGFQFGRNGSTALDWYNTRDPRPDYYRRLPSFFEEDNPEMALAIENELRANEEERQLDWDYFYEINQNSYETIRDVDGIDGNDTTINRAQYIIADRRYDSKKFNLNSILNYSLTDNITLDAGVFYQYNRTHNYQLVEDLLGAEYYVDWNQFAERDFPDNDTVKQNDLNQPNRLIQEGDEYGYDYYTTVCKKGAWAQSSFSFSKVDFFVAANFSHTRFWRTGNAKNGLFPDNSEGNSDKKNFFNTGLKGGITYKVNGRNYLFANGGFLTRAPFVRNSFVSPRTRNDIVGNLVNEKIYSLEGGYLLKAPKVKGRAVFYYTQFVDQTSARSFYYDLERNFINLVQTGINKQHLGTELAIEVEVAPGLKATGVAAIGQYIYNSRPSATLTVDNSSEVIEENKTLYLENFYVANGPQSAYTFGLSYNSPKYWFARINFNYFDNIYLDPNPLRRTTNAVDGVDPDSELFDNIISQTQVPGQFTMDIFGGASWKLDKYFPKMKRPYYLYLNVGISNVTNNQNFITGGFEQTRLDFESKDIDRFPPRLFYSFGTNFFVNLSFRM